MCPLSGSEFFTAVEHGDVMVLDLLDPFTVSTTLDLTPADRHKLFQEQLTTFLETHRPTRVVVNFQKVSGVFTTAMNSAFLIAKRQTDLYQCQWRFCSVPEEARYLFEISKLDSFFPLHDTVEAAMESLNGQAG